MAPPGPVKIGHKKDGCRRRPHRFHVSRPPLTQSLDPLLRSSVQLVGSVFVSLWKTSEYTNHNVSTEGIPRANIFLVSIITEKINYKFPQVDEINVFLKKLIGTQICTNQIGKIGTIFQLIQEVCAKYFNSLPKKLNT